MINCSCVRPDKMFNVKARDLCSVAVNFIKFTNEFKYFITVQKIFTSAALFRWRSLFRPMRHNACLWYSLITVRAFTRRLYLTSWPFLVDASPTCILRLVRKFAAIWSIGFFVKSCGWKFKIMSLSPQLLNLTANFRHLNGITFVNCLFEVTEPGLGASNFARLLFNSPAARHPKFPKISNSWSSSRNTWIKNWALYCVNQFLIVMFLNILVILLLFL
jgi:hypothetical protein